ncbi:hypothetical protein ACYJW8_02040 [Frateuria aurantia]
MLFHRVPPSLPTHGKTLRKLLVAGLSTLLGLAAVDANAAATAPVSPNSNGIITAYKLYTGKDHASHVLKGTINLKDRVPVTAIHFKYTPAHASYSWHNDPEPQYVISLSGTLKFYTRDGETFVLHPGEVLIATDNSGSGHRWDLIDDQPWRRGYIVLKPGEKDSFVPDTKQP